jgi:hypothetical protein
MMRNSYDAEGAPLKALCHAAGSTYLPEPSGYSNPKSFRNCGMPTTAPEACVSYATSMIVQHAYKHHKQAQGFCLMVCQMVASWSSKSVACAATCRESCRSLASMCVVLFFSSDGAMAAM